MESHLTYGYSPTFTAVGVTVGVSRRRQNDRHPRAIRSEPGTEVPVADACQVRAQAQPARVTVAARPLPMLRHHVPDTRARIGSNLFVPGMCQISHDSTVWLRPDVGHSRFGMTTPV